MSNSSKTNSVNASTLKNKNILLIISGGIAAYKALELIRLIRKQGGHVKAIITKGGEEFVTPMSVSALCEHPAYTQLWSLKDEAEMGHIRLSREADLIVIAPATADLMAKMAHGMADDLASTTLLAADKDILIAPAMNHKMWNNPATQTNVKTLQERGILFIGPDEGDMACGEYGFGRMAEPDTIIQSIGNYFAGSTQDNLPLSGKKVLVTAGPTYEPVDPVRFIGNRSSGKQGFAIAKALRAAGAQVTLVTGPVALSDPDGITTIHVETATDMFTAASKALPADIGIFTAAVSDWSAKTIMKQKIKKHGRKDLPTLELKENPDILEALSRPSKKRPTLMIGFAAETENLLQYAKEKQQRKNCDWIIANDVSGKDGDQVFGSDENHAYLIKDDKVTEWSQTSKDEIATLLIEQIIQHFSTVEKNGKRQDAIAAE